MKTDRELMQQALEAMRFALHVGFDESSESQIKKGDKAVRQHENAIAALRERLAQPEQKPVALPEKIYEFVPTPEPAKWHHPECEGACIACLIEQVVQEAYGSQGLGYLQRHLTTPPQRKPLTDEQIKVGWRTLPIQAPMSWSAYLAGARMAEAANGITGEQHG